MPHPNVAHFATLGWGFWGRGAGPCELFVRTKARSAAPPVALFDRWAPVTIAARAIILQVWKHRAGSRSHTLLSSALELSPRDSDEFPV